MITGIGIDIIEKKRIKALLERHPRFADRILTERELKEFQHAIEKRKIEILAGRFAAKEAFAKAAGVGIGKDLSFQSIEINKDEKGKPFFSKPENKKVHLSISHSEEYVVAQAVIEECQ